MDKALGHPGGEVIAGSALEGWQPIATAPVSEDLLLWWVPASPNPLAETVVVGRVSSYGPNGENFDPPRYWWGHLGYQPISHITHWMRPPARPDHIADAGKMIPSPQPPTQPPASEDSRAELNRLAEMVKELEGA